MYNYEDLTNSDLFGTFAEKQSKQQEREIQNPFFVDLLEGRIESELVLHEDYLKVSDDYSVDFKLSNETYHATSDYLSSSRIKEVFKSEQHFVNYKSKTPTDSMKKGTVIHDVFEEIIQGKYKSKREHLASWKPIWKTKIDIEKREITPALYETIRNVLNEVERLKLEPILKNAIAELSVFDEVNKEKVRPDVFVPGSVYGCNVLMPIKTASNLKQFFYQIPKYNYDVSFGMYAHHIEQLTGEPVKMCLIVVDMSANGMIKLIEVSDYTLQEYIEKYKEAKELIKQIDKAKPKGYELEII